MNKFWSFLCLAVIFCSHTFSCVDETEDYILCEKVYVEPQQIIFSDFAIYVNLSNRLIETTCIFADHHGLYFTDYKQKKCDKGQWQCRICAHCNPNYKIWCEVCAN